MKLKASLISRMSLWGMLLLTVVVLGGYYLGGEVPYTANPEMSEPVNTEWLLYLSYFLCGLGLCLTLIFALFQFGTKLVHNPKDAVMTIVYIGLFAVLMGICWSLGSSEPLEIGGYEGTENKDPFWLKLTDMFVYSATALIVVAVIGMSGIIKYALNLINR